MSQKILAYFNHAEEDIPIKNLLEDLCDRNDIDFLNIENNEAWLHNAHIGVIHGNILEKEGERYIDRNYYEYLSQDDVLTKNGLIVIFVSSQPSLRPVKRIHYVSNDGEECVRYLLPVPRTMNSGLVPIPDGHLDREGMIERWQRLLEAVKDNSTLEAWFDKVGHFKILDDIFREGPATNLLPILAILCQGYLAVHATYKPDWRIEDIAPALKLMGWDAQLPRMNEGEVLPANPQQAKEDVRDCKWWLEAMGVLDENKDLLPERWSVLKSTLAQECKRREAEEIPKGLSELLNALSGASEKVSPPSIVSKAYCELVETLGRQ